MRVIVDSARVCEYNSHTFPKKDNDLYELNRYEPVSGRIAGLRISLASEKSRILLNFYNISNNFRSVDRGYDPKHGV